MEIAGLPNEPEAALRRQEVRAPAAGRIVERKVDLGMAVGRDNLETELFVIAVGRLLVAVFHISAGALMLASGVILFVHALDLVLGRQHSPGEEDAPGPNLGTHQLATAYYANRPPGVRMDWVGFAMELIDPKKAFSPSTRHSLETLSNDDLLGPAVWRSLGPRIPYPVPIKR